MLVEITQIACSNCGLSFWITDEHQTGLQRSHKTFYCPNGHAQAYKGETCESKLERVRRQLTNEVEDGKYLARSNSALRGVITKMKAKIDIYKE